MFNIILTAIIVAIVLDAMTFRFALRMLVLRWRLRRVALAAVLVAVAIVLWVYGEVIVNVLAVAGLIVALFFAGQWLLPRLWDWSGNVRPRSRDDG